MMTRHRLLCVCNVNPAKMAGRCADRRAHAANAKDILRTCIEMHADMHSMRESTCGGVMYLPPGEPRGRASSVVRRRRG